MQHALILLIAFQQSCIIAKLQSLRHNMQRYWVLWNLPACVDYKVLGSQHRMPDATMRALQENQAIAV